ncbi:uncharacterized protein [Diadema setosum]|uniref:uncharacterized protein n=1 Tax=Diadema setosum TaxID=31175 RepID=UPI003B3A7444
MKRRGDHNMFPRKFFRMAYRKSFDPGGHCCGIAGVSVTKTMTLLLLCAAMNTWYVSGEVDTNIRVGARSGMGRVVVRQEFPSVSRKISLEHRPNPHADHAVTWMSGVPVGHRDERVPSVSRDAATTSSLSAADTGFQTLNQSHQRTHIGKGSPVYVNQRKNIRGKPVQKLPKSDMSNNAIHVNKEKIDISHDSDLQSNLISIRGEDHSILRKVPDISQVRDNAQQSDSFSETPSLSGHDFKKHTLLRREAGKSPDAATTGTPPTKTAMQKPADSNSDSSLSDVQRTAPANPNKPHDTTLVPVNSNQDGKVSATKPPTGKPTTAGIKGENEANGESVSTSKASLGANPVSKTRSPTTTAKKAGQIVTSAAEERVTHASALQGTASGSDIDAACDQAQCFASRLPYHWTTDASWALASITFLLCVLTFFVLYTGLWKKRNMMGYPLENISQPNPHRRINVAELLRSKLAKIPRRLRNTRPNHRKKMNGRRYEELPLRLPNGSCYDDDEVEMDIFEDEEDDLYFRDEHTV